MIRKTPSAVLIELDPTPHRGVRWIRVLLAAGVALALLAPFAAQTSDESPAPVTSAATVPVAGVHPPPLALPADVTDAQLYAFPDWLANEPPPAALRGVVAVRGTFGIASVEGPRVINWTERGISYSLESTTRTVAELVRLADQLP